MTREEAQAKVEEWLTKTPLYEEFTDDDGDSRLAAIAALSGRTRPFDMYCVHCKGPSTFTPQRDATLPPLNTIALHAQAGAPNPLLNVAQFRVSAVCARAPGHVARFIFLHRPGHSLQKIGQYPSLADLSIPETSQFVKVLGQDRVRELNKAIGLAAHGVGAGSYIYLRRIFESLVEEAHNAALQAAKWDETDDGWNEDAYQQSRMLERVAMLRAHLPAFLVEHPQLYGILSKHIHELSEDECLRNFNAMKEAILIIARDKLKEREEQEQRERASKLLQEINSAIKK